MNHKLDMNQEFCIVMEKENTIQVCVNKSRALGKIHTFHFVLVRSPPTNMSQAGYKAGEGSSLIIKHAGH